ncbi:fimbrial major subunit CsuA/B family protein [Xylophilus sp. Kf1]|nr:fimbrial major subunit CsuA/B family protein [Xylophilus sp. Kf1]
MSARRALIRLCASLAGLLSLAAGAAGCGVANAGLAFGGYDPFDASPHDSATGIVVGCDVAVPYTLALSGGQGGLSDRRMAGPATQGLRYGLFVDASRTTAWGDGGFGTTTVSGHAASAHHTVYGRMPARQNVGAGLYLDQLTITVTY